MSSLVAYASSEDSDSNDDEVVERKNLSTNNQPKGKSPDKKIDVRISQPVSRNEVKKTNNNSSSSCSSSKENNNANADADDGNSEERNMFRVLPTPSKEPGASEVLPEDDLEDLVKPKKSQMTRLPKPLPLPSKRVQISIPALDSDSEDEEEIVPKKKPKFSGSNNLLDMLPPPKHMSIKQTNRTLIPYTLGKKPPPVKKANSTKIQNVGASKSSAPKILTEYNSDEDEDMTTSSNFFSLDTTEKKTQQLPYSAPFMHTIKSNSDVNSVPLPSSNVTTFTPFVQDSCVGVIPENTEVPMYPQYQPQPVETYYQENTFEPQSSSSDQDLSNMENLLQDEQFLRLQGKSQRGKEQIHIVDVNTDDFIDPSELTKTLTQEMPKHSYKKNKDAPSKQSRNKHQITYLAYQAKEMELELKNQWSQNRMTKRQTQAKYGF